MVRMLETKSVGCSAASPSVAMVFFDADANTSAGAPCVICVARSELAPYVIEIVVPGCAAVKLRFSWSNASVSDDAASIRSAPDRAAPLPWAAEVRLDGPTVDDEQPATTIAAMTMISRFTNRPPRPRRRHWST